MDDDFYFSLSPSDELLGLRFYQYGWEQCAPLHSFGPAVRNHYLFHYIISGRGLLDSNVSSEHFQTYHLKAGQGFLICPNQINTYTADKDDPWKYVWLEFDGLQAAEFLHTAGLGITNPIYQPDNMALADEVKNTMLYIAGHPNASTLHRVGHLCLLLDTLIRSSSTRREPRKSQLRDFYVQEAITFMEQNYQRSLTVEAIAEVCKLDRSYFSKLFKERKGCPPQEFLIRMRLGKAAEMMKTTSISISDISAACGYPNQLHFSRLFKQRYGVSPRKWRSQNKLREIE